MKIKVKQCHIDKGEVGVFSKCPVALAISEVTGDRTLVTPYAICSGSVKNRVRTPHEVRIFMKKFDSGDPVEPFEFELENYETDSTI